MLSAPTGEHRGIIWLLVLTPAPIPNHRTQSSAHSVRIAADTVLIGNGTNAAHTFHQPLSANRFENKALGGICNDETIEIVSRLQMATVATLPMGFQQRGDHLQRFCRRRRTLQ